MCGGQLDVKPIYSLDRCVSEVLEIPIPNLIFQRYFFQSNTNHALLYPCKWLETNQLNFVIGHDNVVQLGCTVIRLWYKQAQQYSRTHQLGFIRTVSWCAQNGESHWSHVHITLKVEHIDFHAFYKKYWLQRDLMSCLSCLTLKRR